MKTYLHSLPVITIRPGDRVVFAFPNAGYPDEQKENQRLRLVEGEVYTLSMVDAHSFHTDVGLEEFPGHAFNSVFFALEEEKVKEGPPEFRQWFDINNIDHRRTYLRIRKGESWPEGFLPAGIQMGPCWYFWAAEQYIVWLEQELKLTTHGHNLYMKLTSKIHDET